MVSRYNKMLGRLLISLSLVQLTCLGASPQSPSFDTLLLADQNMGNSCMGNQDCITTTFCCSAYSCVHPNVCL
jgi:hypothetical protein